MASQYIVMLLFMGIPIILTIINIYNATSTKPLVRFLIDTLIFTLGPILTITLYLFTCYVPYSTGNYQSVSILYQPIFNHIFVLVPAVLSFIAYILMRARQKPMPRPLTMACIGTISIGICICVVWIFQIVFYLFPHQPLGPFLMLFLGIFPLNFIVSSISLFKIELPKLRQYAA